MKYTPLDEQIAALKGLDEPKPWSQDDSLALQLVDEMLDPSNPAYDLMDVMIAGANYRWRCEFFRLDSKGKPLRSHAGDDLKRSTAICKAWVEAILFLKGR